MPDWDPEPAHYVYRNEFHHDGDRLERTGVIGLAQLHDWSEHVVCPHERTRPAWVTDRQSLWAACRTDLSLGITLMKDPKLRFLSLLRAAPYADDPITARTPDGALHEIGRVTDPTWCRTIRERLRYARLYVADGHHRYEAALRHRDATQSAGSAYSMLHIVSAHDPGLVVLPSHCLIRGALPPRPAIELPDVHRRLLPLALERLADAWKNNHEVWFVSRACVEAFAPYSELAHQIGDSAGAWGDESAVATTPHAQVAVSAVASGTATAAVLPPALEPGVVTQVADQRRTLLPKSTYFWPKPMAGLVLRTLDPPEAFN